MLLSFIQFISTHRLGDIMEKRLTDRLKNTNPFFVYTALFILYEVLYVITNRIPTFYGPFELPKIFYEDQIPLIPETSLVYISIFGFMAITIWMLPRKYKNPTAIIFMYLLFIHTFIFLFFPTIYPREEITNKYGIFDWLMHDIIQELDTPRNCFPSLHVSLPFTMAFVWLKLSKKIGIVILFIATLIALSTLTTKQHYLLDVFSAIAVSFILVQLKFKNPQTSFY
ncbi:MAG: phosphatase PAP2 family protein [Candidatus Magasanikbacteria bacterium]|nr:phosphatase PAP2 family protein [Candidatus Magasanikbacteria bacterium]